MTGELHRSLGFGYALLGDGARARQHAHAAIVALEGQDPGLLALALARHILVETHAGAPVEEGIVERALMLEQESQQPPSFDSPAMNVAIRRLHCGYVEEAWQGLARFRRACLDYGDEGLANLALWHLSEAGVRPGPARARRRARSAVARASSSASASTTGPTLGCALLRSCTCGGASRPETDEAIADARESRRLALEENAQTFAMRNLTTIAFVELSRGDAEAAWTILEPLPDEVAAMGRHGPVPWSWRFPWRQRQR